MLVQRLIRKQFASIKWTARCVCNC